MNELHLFAGAGGGILGGIVLGHTCVCAVEIEPYCQKVLLQRQRDGILPKFPIWDDVKTFDGKPWKGHVDIVCGGFPCQDISSIGTTKSGICGERSGLWVEMARIICEVQPKYVFVENSPMLVGRGLGLVLLNLAQMGYDAKWGVIGARHCGADHARDRIWVYAYSNSQRLQEDSNESGVRIKASYNWNSRQFRMLCGSRIWPKPRPIGAYPMGVGNGMAHTVDRIKAAGNGQVPIVAATAWRTLRKL